jgi:hypothetical protein
MHERSVDARQSNRLNPARTEENKRDPMGAGEDVQLLRSTSKTSPNISARRTLCAAAWTVADVSLHAFRNSPTPDSAFPLSLRKSVRVS